jgi:ATP-dependent exoDNAse (exonuclease V) alpha subunit
MSHPGARLAVMAPVSSLQFAAAARALAEACRRRGIEAPSFRSPPRSPALDRSLRRRPDGGAVVAVRLGDRPFEAVLVDMVEGVVASAGLGGAAAVRCRAELWAAVAPGAPPGAVVGGRPPAGAVRPTPRVA